MDYMTVVVRRSVRVIIQHRQGVGSDELQMGSKRNQQDIFRDPRILCGEIQSCWSDEEVICKQLFRERLSEKSACDNPKRQSGI